jgi:hypothetical protein
LLLQPLCCCLSHGQGEPGMHPHALTPRFLQLEPSGGVDVSLAHIVSEPACLSGTISANLPDSFQRTLVLEFVRTTVLLI